METFTPPKQFVENPDYYEQRRKNLASLTDSMIDHPIISIVNDLNKLSYCFTLQSCFGHFVYEGCKNEFNTDPLPNIESIIKVEYRIAYIALCIENSAFGKELLEKLTGITTINPEIIQFCSANWFWERQVNSYALQVVPDRFKDKDKVIIDFTEAILIEKVRNEFFNTLVAGIALIGFGGKLAFNIR